MHLQFTRGYLNTYFSVSNKKKKSLVVTIETVISLPTLLKETHQYIHLFCLSLLTLLPPQPTQCLKVILDPVNKWGKK